jgi:hypothetical protein
MKTIALFTAIALSVTAVWLNQPGDLIPAKEEYPRVLVKSGTTSSSQPLLCPVVGEGKIDIYTAKEYVDENEAKVVHGYTHCRKCEIGALLPLENNPSTGRCSHCNALYENTFSLE